MPTSTVTPRPKKTRLQRTLRRMNRVHAAVVRTESSDPAVIEITPR